MKKYFIVAFLFLMACQDYKPKDTRKIPKNLLSKQQVIQALVEINLAEAMVSMANLPFEQGVYRYRKYEKHCFEKLKIDSLAFLDSYQYYFQSIDDGDYICNAVLDSMLLRQARKNID